MKSASWVKNSKIITGSPLVVIFELNGQESMCGWLKDKFGVSWQIVPKIIAELMNEPARAERITKAFMNMKKLDIEVLKNA